MHFVFLQTTTKKNILVISYIVVYLIVGLLVLGVMVHLSCFVCGFKAGFPH